MSAPVVSGVGLTRTFGRPGSAGAVTAVRDVDVAFEPGVMHAVVGPSGSGKSTLLHLLSTLDQPTSRKVLHGGQLVSGLRGRAAARIRQRTGFVFQRFNLVPSLSAQDNITLPLRLRGRDVDPEHYSRLVDQLGLQGRLHHHPHELSGGQQQRVAIARALLHRPPVLFADEPTGSLDSTSARHVTEPLADCNSGGTTVIVVTHDEQVARAASRVVRVRDGGLEDQ